MPTPFSILVLDLHNTIYDEVREYGLAIDEAIRFWLELAKKQEQLLTRETICKELSVTHRTLASDWDGDAWKLLPCLARLGLNDAELDKAVTQAENKRRKKSLQLTVSGFYGGVLETLRTLNEKGMRIYLITEASADAAMNAITWLKLGGIVHGVYSYPSRKEPKAVAGTYHRPFPPVAQTEFLKKPHPYLLAALILDEALERGIIPFHVHMEEVFSVVADEDFAITELSENAVVQRDVSARLELRDTPHKLALQTILDSILYVGDSKFKDGLLARNTGVAFGYAAYGKKVDAAHEKEHKQSLEIMYAVTGWEKDVLKLTQEAARSETVNRLKPDYIFEHSLKEALPLFAA